MSRKVELKSDNKYIFLFDLKKRKIIHCLVFTRVVAVGINLPDEPKEPRELMSYIERKNGVVVVKPGVDIIASQCASLKEELLQILKDGEKKIIIDLQDIQMIDSSGIGLLISTQNSLKDSGGEGIELINISDDIHKLFIAMRLDQHFKM